MGGAREGSKQFLFAYGFQNTIRGIIREGITRIGVCPLPKLVCVVFWALLGGVCYVIAKPATGPNLECLAYM